MLKDLFKPKREGEDKSAHPRSDRFIQHEGHWFFKTREGEQVGPFSSRNEAQYALLYFIERNAWPSQQELASFIEGLELLADTEQ